MAWTREPLTEDELSTLLEAADEFDLDHQVTIYTLAHIGMRADELAHMTGDWVDWKNERLRVPPQEGAWSPKTDHAARTIPIKQPETLRRLRDFFGYHEAYGATRQTVTNRVKRVAAETELRKNITPRVLRNTYGTLIAARGATPKYIRQTMGHADLSSANDYLQYAGTQLDAEAEKLW